MRSRMLSPCLSRATSWATSAGLPVRKRRAKMSEGRLNPWTLAPVEVLVSGNESSVPSESRGKRVALPTCWAATVSSETVFRNVLDRGFFAPVRKQDSEA